MAEGARLESVYTETYRGFESLPHRQSLSKPRFKRGFVVFGHNKTEKAGEVSIV